MDKSIRNIIVRGIVDIVKIVSGAVLAVLGLSASGCAFVPVF